MTISGNHLFGISLAALVAMQAITVAAQQNAAVAARPAANDEMAGGRDDEIVVTARKREERAIDVPIALTAISGEALEQRGAKNLSDFLQEAPGVGAYDQGLRNQKITIRGISTSLVANENGYYLNDLPFTGVAVQIAPDVRAWISTALKFCAIRRGRCS
ncbi:TonB-dependent receptor plug domain-containing protein [Sphingobium sp.]|uniref:TonB-dependent receptor plug domain-containing protein n=1 Tax=Sphingobium sp. TaxID=1912891 RepID=UPI0025EB3685|nr:TonB-dependent receptor plug domain-containing protein [Sphingobium sp.]